MNQDSIRVAIRTLRKQRQDIDAAIKALEILLGGGAHPTGPIERPAAETGQPESEGTWRRCEAILQRHGQAMLVSELEAALANAGVILAPKAPRAYLSTLLRRKPDVFVRFDPMASGIPGQTARGTRWGLKCWTNGVRGRK